MFLQLNPELLAPFLNRAISPKTSLSYITLPIYHAFYLKYFNTSQQNAKNITAPPAKIHLSFFALRSTIRIVSPLTPSVFATLYNLFCVPFSTSRCWPRSPRAAWPRAKYSSRAAWVFAKKFCSRSTCASRSASPLPKLRCDCAECDPDGAHGLAVAAAFA